MLKSRDREILEYLNKYKAISIKQASRLFFSDVKYKYDSARKRLKQLEEMEVVKSYLNKITKEKIYYTNKKLSAHDLYIFEFYTLLIEHGCEVLEFKLQPQYLKRQVRPDAFLKFKYDNLIYVVLLEVDLTHFTGMSKMQMYEMLYKTKEIQNEHDVFPIIAIIGDNNLKYESNNFDVVYLPFKNIDVQKIIYD